MSSDSEIGLFCLFHPTSREKLIPVIKSSLSYVSSPESRLTTFSYFVPSKRKGATNAYAKNSPEVVAGVELYSEKLALSKQLDHPSYQAFRKSIDKINERPEEMMAIYPITNGGFAYRSSDAPAKDAIVVIARITAKEGKRDELLAVFGSYANSVKSNEPDVLTYAAFTRKKSPNEVIVFERYRNLAAIVAHGKSNEYKKMGKETAPFVTGMEISEWTELSDISFIRELDGNTAKL